MSNIEEQFVNAENAIALFDLGYKGESFGYYNQSGHSGKWLFDKRIWESSTDFVDAPTWLQAFDWFSDKHKLFVIIRVGGDNNWYDYVIRSLDGTTLQIQDAGTEDEYHLDFYVQKDESFEIIYEARKACLNKLIEIVKQR